MACDDAPGGTAGLLFVRAVGLVRIGEWKVQLRIKQWWRAIIHSCPGWWWRNSMWSSDLGAFAGALEFWSSSVGAFWAE